ncbi:TonB-dependent receptor [Microscilla marina]|uniref:TonB-dependent receptor, putative n=1 Tax=Microscilla marina ATCC 23134 TaxID=313606 RepID=A1ZZW7_MICM2|nr:TonB-dependent receptor [Microscilla marina]EAY24083.1 TonB-dependent receptor, putative [Microscilla marina ATCC 23134]
MQRILLTFIGILLGASVFAQTGTIRGTVTDAKTGETLIGATVVIKGTTNGAPTDIDGKYTLGELAAGKYTLLVQYVSYQNKEVKDIEVKAGQVTIQDVKLGSDAKVLETVVVTARIEKKAEIALLTMQRKSALVQDGISAQAISRAGDSNAAGAIKRVTGVSVEGGKYVYVRGLGDRYTKTTLNGADIPGLDPNRNSVQMDLFPSNMIDNMVILKTFSPDLPGNFTGGYINITTKDFPDRFTFQVNASLGFNDQATFNSDFLSYNGGSMDYLGFDDGGRQLPVSREDALPGKENFSKDIRPVTKSPFLNQSYSVSVGNQYTVAGRPLGFIAALSYRKNNQYYDNGKIGEFGEKARLGRFSLNSDASVINSLNPEYTVRNNVGTENVLWGAVLNTSYKVTDKSKIGLNLMHNQSGKTETRVQQGKYQDLDPANTFNSIALDFLSRSLSSAQLKGEHAFGEGGNNIKLDWITSFTVSRLNQPDLRFFSYENEPNGSIVVRSNAAPRRFYRDLTQTNWDNKINLTLPFKLGENKGKLKTGVAYVSKNRDFSQTIFAYASNRTDFAADANGGFDFNTYVDVPGTRIQNGSQDRDVYNGKENIFGAYIMADTKLSPKLRMLAGVRFERTDISVISNDVSLVKGLLENNDILPAINLTYSLTENMNLRLAYGRTLARPVFRELAPFDSFDAFGGLIYVGNPNLKRSLIDNVDLRWEMYPTPGEIITVSAFFKNIKNPIATAFSAFTPNQQVTWVNQEDAQLFGAEVELRKKLGFIGLKDFTIGANASFIVSALNIEAQELSQIRANDVNRVTELAQDGTRPLFAQSPFLINANLNYNNINSGWSASLNFNIFGERMAIVSRNGVPDVYEQPRPVLDLTVGKSLGERWKLTLKARNLLNPEYKFLINFKDAQHIVNNYTVGRTFSLGVRYLID